ncbi:ABC transporter substrate-binding protein [Devosia sp. PTR5]|uniref:ABC transporter substrate-binding protein n=1 Tax=Devosia oryzisoli TaxID=2774138 RepID=A0A927ISY7_9HYPH|nr:ABC transporter substrate-binding protein [Devosia oryzisoli]MBD8065989.1 ABC transporter substrate-binding protein [Devosia oryzisoli]
MRKLVLLLATASSLCLSGGAFAAGTMNVALIGEVDTLDPMISTKAVVNMVTQHFYETLYALDESWEPQPLLAAGPPEYSNGDKTIRIPLRTGIKFHDGSDMTSADVVDSLNRWLEVSPRAKEFKPLVKTITADGDDAIVIELTDSYAPLLSLLSFPSAPPVVVPQEIISADQLTATVGTGPYTLAEYKPDQYMRATRFDGYQSPEGAPSFLAGERQQNLDEIRFIPVPDANTRMEGLASGQFDYADGIQIENYDRLLESDATEPVLMEDAFAPNFALNHKAGLMTNPDLRKAVQYALAPEDMLLAAVGNDVFFEADGALYPKGHVWHNEAGVEEYNVNDPARAKQHLDAGGYDGTPLRILTSHQYEFHFKMAEVAKFYLENAGFKVELVVVDWATLGEKRNDPKEWDIYITHSPFLPDPAINQLLSADSNIGWSDPEKDAALKELATETDLEARKEIFAHIQELYFRDVPYIKVGNISELRGSRKGVTGVPLGPWMVFWNAKLPD